MVSLIDLFGFSLSKAERREVGPTAITGPCEPVILCPLLAYADLVAERKMTDATSGQGEQRGKVYETAAAPASFKSDLWNHFDFFWSRNGK